MNTDSQNIRNNNTQDIFLRNAVLSLLDVLNREIIVDLVRDGKIEKHEIPFFYNMAADEGFMKDFFIQVPDGCKVPVIAEGNYDIVPRGIITLDSFQIKSSDITNKFVRGSFNQQVLDDNDQKVNKAFSARLYSLPMSLKFSAKILCDNLNKTFKIMERLIDLFYKNRVVYFQYKGVRIPGQFTFPESESFEKKYEFDYTTDQRVNITFSIEMETYFPSFNEDSTFYKGNTIRQINLNTKLEDTGVNINSTFIDEDHPPSE
jgi:hypothetical protein